jgi:alpha-beta hydrolase superfamily lysophospholipase
MNATLPFSRTQAGPDCEAEALYVDSGPHRIFGWLHRPTTERRADLGLVICNPFGYEALCSHRSVRSFAESAAAIGVPTLRFDYSGTGDSADIDSQAEQVGLWTRDVVSAVAELKRRTGVTQVCLLGIRLGGLIATLAAPQCGSSLQGLILIAPVISGRRYLKEMRTSQLAALLGNRTPQEQESSARAELTAQRDGSAEAGGFYLSAASVESLQTIDLMKLAVAPGPEILIIDGDTQPAARRWADRLTEIGAKPGYLALPGLIQMTLTPPQFAAVPRQMVEASCDWLAQRAVLAQGGLFQQEPRNAVVAAPASEPSAAVLQMSAATASGNAKITERPLHFGADGALFGIVTEPPAGEKRRRAVILLNAGADHHIAPSGMYVSLARRWAARGYYVLRMDFAGIGDSRTRAGGRDDDVFPQAAVNDVRAAIELMSLRYQCTDISVAGLCAGAYHALRCAIDGAPVNRVMMINALNFFWDDRMSLDDVQLSDVVRNPGVYRARALSASAWKRFLTGRVNFWRILKIFVKRPLLAAESTIRDVARRLRVHLPQDLGWELERIAERGIQMVFIFARGEPGIDLLRIQAGNSLQRIGDRCHIHILETGDHVFSMRATRAVMETVLDQELFARNDRQSASRSGVELEHSS